jgi:hypothetical protein
MKKTIILFFIALLPVMVVSAQSDEKRKEVEFKYSELLVKQFKLSLPESLDVAKVEFDLHKEKAKIYSKRNPDPKAIEDYAKLELASLERLGLTAEQIETLRAYFSDKNLYLEAK